MKQPSPKKIVRHAFHQRFRENLEGISPALSNEMLNILWEEKEQVSIPDDDSLNWEEYKKRYKTSWKEVRERKDKENKTETIARMVYEEMLSGKQNILDRWNDILEQARNNIERRRDIKAYICLMEPDFTNNE